MLDADKQVGGSSQGSLEGGLCCAALLVLKSRILHAQKLEDIDAIDAEAIAHIRNGYFLSFWLEGFLGNNGPAVNKRVGHYPGISGARLQEVTDHVGFVVGVSQESAKGLGASDVHPFSLEELLEALRTHACETIRIRIEWIFGAQRGIDRLGEEPAQMVLLHGVESRLPARVLAPLFSKHLGSSCRICSVAFVEPAPGDFSKITNPSETHGLRCLSLPSPQAPMKSSGSPPLFSMYALSQSCLLSVWLMTSYSSGLG